MKPIIVNNKGGKNQYLFINYMTTLELVIYQAGNLLFLQADGK